jgi:hypothetical protein
MTPSPFNEDVLIKVRNKYRIGQAECIRQGLVYHSRNLTPNRLAEVIDNYYRFGTIPIEVQQYANGVLNETIKLDSV